jgi:aminopeptidase N
MRVSRAAALLMVAVLCVGCTPETKSAEDQVSGTPGARTAGDSYYPTSGNGGYDASNYVVAITYDPKSHQLDGDTTITANAKQSLSEFSLDLDGLDVRTVTVDGQAAKTARDGGKLVITPANGVAQGSTFTTEVQYGGVPNALKSPKLGAEGWQISSSGGAFAAGEPHSASTWYPVNDTPTDKASFHLAAKVPDGWSVISNGVQGRDESKDGWTTFRWDEPDPIASYLTTVGIDHWTMTTGKLADGTPVVSAFAPGTDDKKALEDRLPEILDFLSSKFGKYPQDAAGGIFLADKIGFSLETQTRPIFAQWTDLTTIVHENAHQWWGDSVSVQNWKDVCLNECMASYAQWLWSEAKEGVNLDDRYRKLVQQGQKVFAGKLYDMGAGNEFGAVYTKGPMALHALRRTIGDDAFFKILKTWPALHRDGNATWPQFESYVELISGKDLHGFFDAWFRGTTQPADQYLWPGTLKP